MAVASCAVISAAASAQETDLKVDVIASGFEKPWSIAALPNGDFLITERPGNLRLVQGGELVETAVAGVPPVLYSSQGGLFDIVLHPDYKTNRTVYLTYAHGEIRENATRVARATYSDGALTDLEVLYTYQPSKDTPVHFGGQLAFLPDGTFVVTTGDGV